MPTKSSRRMVCVDPSTVTEVRGGRSRRAMMPGGESASRTETVPVVVVFVIEKRLD